MSRGWQSLTDKIGRMRRTKADVPPCGPSYKGVCCEHMKSQEHDDSKTVTEYVCCNCGSERRETNFYKTATWTNTGQVRHGPYTPSK